MKLLAIASGDWHLHVWKNYNTENIDRYKVGEKFLDHLLHISHNREIPILFTGDFLHIPASISNKLLAYLVEYLTEASRLYTHARIIGISGNHDISEGFSFFRTFSKLFPKLITHIDMDYIHINGVMVCGIPYLKFNKGFTEQKEWFDSVDDKASKRILLIHTNLYGAKDPNGYEIDEVPDIPRNLGKYFSGFDLVLSGHIHKYSELWAKNVVMVGAPYQQRTSDSGTSMGYLNIYEDLSYKFVKYDAPEFKYYRAGEGKPDGDNYWIELPEKKAEEVTEDSKFNSKSSKTKLAKQYCRANGVKNKRRRNLLIEVLNKTEE